jgi:hypothetical protein
MVQSYIQQDAKQRLLVSVLVKPPSQVLVVVGWSHSPNTTSMSTSMSHVRNETSKQV